mgnify:CR=1 FL=1
MKGSKLGIRLLYYFGGFFVMTIGIALSVKSNLAYRRSAPFHTP